MYIDTPLGITGGQSYLIVLAICGCSIGILSFFTLVSIIRTLRAEGVHQFPPEDLIEVEREGRMGAADVAMPNVNAALVRNIAEKAQTGEPLIRLRRGSERFAKVNVPKPNVRVGGLRASVSAALRPGVNVRPEARAGVNAALARSIAEKAQRARSVSEKAQKVQQGSKLEVIPGIMVKTRTLSNLEDAKAIIQRKMKEQEDRTRSKSDVEIADAMVMPREKVEEKLERESFTGIQMPREETEETRYADETAVSTYFQIPVKAGMGEVERGPPLNSTDELMRRAAILDVKTLNTEFVELRESLVLLKNKLKDIQEKRKRSPLTPMRQAA